jgi:hypothetical protein
MEHVTSIGEPWCRSWPVPDSRAATQAPLGPAIDELTAAAWLQAFDAAWLSRDWARLRRYIAADVEVLPLGSATLLIGRPAVLASLRRFLRRAVVHEYNATEVRVRRVGRAAL